MQKVRMLLVLVLAAALLLAACAPANQNGGNVPGDNTGALPGDEGLAEEPGGLDEEVPQTGDQVTCDAQALVATGETLYAEQCASCHGEMGEGVEGFPGLANSPNLTADDALTLVQNYLAVDAHPMLAADELAGVLTYVRSSWGNTGMVVCPDEVQLAEPVE